jgi:pre-rRNA-processing protein IPI3
MQCHIQEIITSISVDCNSFYLCGGTKGGRIFLWELASGNLIQSWQAHFKSVTVTAFSDCGNFLISGSEDGMVRSWDVISILNSLGSNDSRLRSDEPQRSVTPFR